MEAKFAGLGLISKTPVTPFPLVKSKGTQYLVLRVMMMG